jgi:hypothetical protein
LQDNLVQNHEEFQPEFDTSDFEKIPFSLVFPGLEWFWSKLSDNSPGKRFRAQELKQITKAIQKDSELTEYLNEQDICLNEEPIERTENQDPYD